MCQHLRNKIKNKQTNPRSPLLIFGEEEDDDMDVGVSRDVDLVVNVGV